MRGELATDGKLMLSAAPGIGRAAKWACRQQLSRASKVADCQKARSMKQAARRKQTAACGGIVPVARLCLIGRPDWRWAPDHEEAGIQMDRAVGCHPRLIDGRH